MSTDETETGAQTRKSAIEFWRISHPDQETLNEARNRMIARLYFDAANWSVLSARTITDVEIVIAEDEAWFPAARRIAKAASGDVLTGIVLLNLRTSRARTLTSLPAPADPPEQDDEFMAETVA